MLELFSPLQYLFFLKKNKSHSPNAWISKKTQISPHKDHTRKKKYYFIYQNKGDLELLWQLIFLDDHNEASDPKSR